MGRTSRLSSLQLIGPTALFAAIGAAEAAAWGLHRFPSSEWLWALNLTYFHAFQQVHYDVMGKLGFGYEQFIVIALPLFGAALAGFAFKRHVLLGLASNLSLFYSGFMVFVWSFDRREAPQASLVALYSPSTNPDALVLVLLIGVSLFSFAATHIDFLRRASAEAR
jgi:hypothetical protein